MKIRRDELRDWVENYIQGAPALGYFYSFAEIKYYCENQTIDITEEEIKAFLKTKAKEAGIDMDEKIEGGGSLCLTGSEIDVDRLIKQSVEKFSKQLKRSKFEFNAIDLKYFKDSFRIYKTKCLKLCEIIEMLRGCVPVDRQLLKDLDITYNDDYVSSEDVDRIMNPLINCYLKACDTQFKAENLNTYLTKTLNETSMHHDGVSYGECLPSQFLQDRRSALYGNWHPELYVALTEKQKQQIQKEEDDNIKAGAKFICEMWDGMK